MSLSASFSRAEFESDGFDAKRWINSALASSAGSRKATGAPQPPSSSPQPQTKGDDAMEAKEGDGSLSSASASSSLSHMAMRLQLLMADVESSLTQASSDLTHGLPKSASSAHAHALYEQAAAAVGVVLCADVLCCAAGVACRALRELGWLGREVCGVRASLSELLSDVYSLDREHHSQVQFLSAVDVVKRRVEVVQRAVSEMEEWRRRAEHVSAVIASADLQRIAAELTSLQRTVDSLAQLPQHLTAHHQQQVQQLRARLEELCAPSFTAALQANDLPSMARLCSIYRQMQRSDECRMLYVAHRQRQLQDIARAFVNDQAQQQRTPASSADDGSALPSVPSSAYAAERVRVLPTWLAAFHAALLSFVHEEVACSAQLFPDDGEQSVLLQLLQLTSGEVAQRMQAWIPAWLKAEDGAGAGADHTDAIVGLFPLSLELVRALTRTLRSLPCPSSSSLTPSPQLQQSLDSVTRLLLSPYTRMYPEVFSAQRSSALRALDTLDLGADSYEPAAGQVVACMPTLHSQCDELLQSCLLLTAGMRAPAVLGVVRELLDDFLGRLESLVQRLRKVADAESRRAAEDERASQGGGVGGSMERGLMNSGGGDDWSTMSGLFALLAAVRRVEAEGVHEVERSLRARLLPAAVSLLAAVELQEKGSDREDAEPATIDEEAERLSIFARLLREDEGQRRAVEDLVERYHPQGLSSVQQLLHSRSAVRAAAPHSAPSPALRPFNPPTPTSSDSQSAALSLTLPSTSSSLSSVPLLLSSSVSLLSRVVLLLHGALFERMFGPISSRLQSFASWRQWRSSASQASSSLGVIATEMRQDGSEGEVALPSFSLQPADWATSIGEYLLSLVSVLEPFVQGEAAEAAPLHSELDAAYWLQRLATATCDLLGRCIAALPSLLSPSSVQQLHADLHYIGNVLQAMAIDRSAHIADLQLQVTQRGDRAGKMQGEDAEHGTAAAASTSTLHAEEQLGPAGSGNVASARRP